MVGRRSGPPRRWRASYPAAPTPASATSAVNYVGEHLYSYSTDRSRLRYKMARTLTNLSLNYQLRRGLTVYCDLNNLFQEPQRYYLGAGKSNRLQTYVDNGPSLNFGISGTF